MEQMVVMPRVVSALVGSDMQAALATRMLSIQVEAVVREQRVVTLTVEPVLEVLEVLVAFRRSPVLLLLTRVAVEVLRQELSVLAVLVVEAQPLRVAVLPRLALQTRAVEVAAIRSRQLRVPVVPAS
jgi:hypothetical protein